LRSKLAQAQKEESDLKHCCQPAKNSVKYLKIGVRKNCLTEKNFDGPMVVILCQKRRKFAGKIFHKDHVFLL
jgi:hypothetical protein